jgi:hypothetical protein
VRISGLLHSKGEAISSTHGIGHLPSAGGLSALKLSADAQKGGQGNLLGARRSPRAHRRAVSRAEGWPTWMWAPEAEPVMAPHEAMNGMPDARR